ncbi:Abi family protein [Brevibacterium aurantiacum]|uniref:Abi family protein n=1 Tax=Brevibacterium aurantiacum TaxID=273384 RepID=UPI001F3D3D56|nr:Abi family protein [Brevibacterium aurantiacum]
MNGNVDFEHHHFPSSEGAFPFHARLDPATRIGGSRFNVPTKRLMSSWLASLNYARNVAAHHARLFNRKLQNSPGRPKPDVIPVLNHLREFELKGGYGAYNILAVVAYLLTCIEGGETWTSSLVALLNSFPRSDILDLSSLGVPDDWSDLELWN